MRETAGRVFTMEERHPPLPGCTTSAALARTPDAIASVFTLAAATDISGESYAQPKLLLVTSGQLEAYGEEGEAVSLGTGNALREPLNTPIGLRSATGCTFVELTMRKDTHMNEALIAGRVVTLADLLPYQDGTIVNMDLAHNDAMKLALMSFDAGTGLSEHAAPADALIFALEGEGVIGYEGAEHVIHAGENFKFDRGGRHYVRADKRFKMALLLVR